MLQGGLVDNPGLVASDAKEGRKATTVYKITRPAITHYSLYPNRVGVFYTDV